MSCSLRVTMVTVCAVVVGNGVGITADEAWQEAVKYFSQSTDSIVAAVTTGEQLEQFAKHGWALHGYCEALSPENREQVNSASELIAACVAASDLLENNADFQAWRDASDWTATFYDLYLPQFRDLLTRLNEIGTQLVQVKAKTAEADDVRKQVEDAIEADAFNQAYETGQEYVESATQVREKAEGLFTDPLAAPGSERLALPFLTVKREEASAELMALTEAIRSLEISREQARRKEKRDLDVRYGVFDVHDAGLSEANVMFEVNPWSLSSGDRQEWWEKRVRIEFGFSASEQKTGGTVEQQGTSQEEEEAQTPQPEKERLWYVGLGIKLNNTTNASLGLTLNDSDFYWGLTTSIEDLVKKIVDW